MWAFCCCNKTYYIRMFENNSGLLNVAQRAVPEVVTPANTARRMRLAGGKLFVGTPGVTQSGVYRHVRRYATDLSALEQSFDFTYDTGGSSSTLLAHQFDTDGSSVVCTAARTVATARAGVAVRDSSGSLTWEQSLDTGTTSIEGVAMRSDAEVYAVGNAANYELYRFNTSGTKQWKVTVSGPQFFGLVVDSGNHCWVAMSDGGSGTNLYRYDGSGSVVRTISIGGETVQAIKCDGSTGVWVATSGLRLRHYDDTGASLANVFEANILTGRPLGVDEASADVFTIVLLSTERRVKKFNSSGSAQWTSPTPAMWGATHNLFSMAADASYVWAGGASS